MKINDIIKKAVARLKTEGKLFTPDAYSEAFCKEAKVAGVLVEDCSHVDKYISMLDDSFKKELKNYNIKTISELFRYLTSRINRTKPTRCTELVDAQAHLAKRVLQVVGILHNRSATELSNKTIKLFEEDVSPELLNAMRNNWNNFLTSYDDTFLQELSQFGSVDSSDLSKTIASLKMSKNSAATSSTPATSSEFE
ncbi:MAG: GGDEF domain-containing protein, partial [Campylobacterota bacterium]|nr:GGDEF domain-containing protein [Campylobacterota bacterium]